MEFGDKYQYDGITDGMATWHVYTLAINYFRQHLRNLIESRW
jgi:hypothetical protein